MGVRFLFEFSEYKHILSKVEAKYDLPTIYKSNLTYLPLDLNKVYPQKEVSDYKDDYMLFWILMKVIESYYDSNTNNTELDYYRKICQYTKDFHDYIECYEPNKPFVDLLKVDKA